MSTPLPSADYRPPRLLHWALAIVLGEILLLCIAVWLAGCAVLPNPEGEPSEIKGLLVFHGPCATRIGKFICRAWDVEQETPADRLADVPPVVRRLIGVYDPVTDRMLALLEVVDRETGRQRLLWLAEDLRAKKKGWPRA